MSILNSRGFSEIIYKHPDLVEAQKYAELEKKIVHVYHQEWWGIRSATELLPGWSLAISASQSLDVKALYREISKVSPRFVVFQGYSQNAADAAEYLYQSSRREYEIHVVTHVSAAQFDNQFEVDMLAVMLHQKRRRVVKKLWSVKPGFSHACDGFEQHLLINTAPGWEETFGARETSAALIPLTRGLRKNMQANHIALCRSSYKTIFSSLESADLRGIVDDTKIIHLGHIPQKTVKNLMASVGLVANVTLIECQPMVFNEAISVATPCLTGPLNLPFLSNHPLRQLTEIREPDNIKLIISKAEEIKDLWQSAKNALPSMCRDYHSKIREISAESYAEAFGGS
jgi:hypothetical protein